MAGQAAGQFADQSGAAAVNGNLRRSATYVRIRAAIHDAARTLEG